MADAGDDKEWDAIEPLPWDDPQAGAFYVGFQMGLERAAEAIEEHELRQVFGARIAKLAVDNQILVIREENYRRALRAASKAGKSLADYTIAVTAQGIKLRPHDLVERAEQVSA
jgi:hypothetical protein